jgi:hypothetical protein
MILAVFFCLAALVVAACRFIQPPPRIDQASYEMIQIGMTEREVEALIGAPAGDYGVGQGWYAIGDHFYSVSDPCEPDESRWIGQGHAIVVRFDSKGKVDLVSIGQTQREYDSWLHRIGWQLYLCDKQCVNSYRNRGLEFKR